MGPFFGGEPRHLPLSSQAPTRRTKAQTSSYGHRPIDDHEDTEERTEGFRLGDSCFERSAGSDEVGRSRSEVVRRSKGQRAKQDCARRRETTSAPENRK